MPDVELGQGVIIPSPRRVEILTRRTIGDMNLLAIRYPDDTYDIWRERKKGMVTSWQTNKEEFDNAQQVGESLAQLLADGYQVRVTLDRHNLDSTPATVMAIDVEDELAHVKYEEYSQPGDGSGPLQEVELYSWLNLRSIWLIFISK